MDPCPKNPENETGLCCGKCCTKIEKLSVVRGGKVILDDVNLHIHCGELTAVIGPNGAGKSTLLKAMIGEVPYQGKVNFRDASGVKSGRPLIGYVPQRWDFDPGSPVSVLDLYAASLKLSPVWLTGARRIRKNALESLARVEVAHLVDRRLGELSGGEIQRVLLALALEPLPELLLLDEPVSGIDFTGRELFYRTVSELRERYDLSIILVSHDLELVGRFADRMVLLNKSVQCVGTPESVLTDEGVLRSFGRRVVGIEGCGEGRL